MSLYIITYMYLQYDTVVSTDYIKFSYLPLPAVTACVPFAISYSDLCLKLNFTDQTVCYEYMKRTHHISSLDDFVTSLTPDGEMGLVQSFHTDRYLTSGPVMRLIDFSFFRTAKLNCVAATGKVKTSYAGLDYFAQSNCHSNHNTSSRVFSLIYNNRKIGRSAQLCQTFFSHYDPDYDESLFTINLKLNSNKMAFFKFELLSSWFPPGHKPEGISISLHPPNLIPSDLDFKYFHLKGNKSYEIEFEREISNLLPPPYKTMCDNYNSTEIEGISKIDCIRLCVFRRSWDDKLQCRNQWNVILLHELNRNETLCPFDDSKDDQYYQIREDCEGKCRKNCVEQDYEVLVEVVDEHLNGLFNHIPAEAESNDSTLESTAFPNINDVTIKHHTGPELIITHSADTIFSTFMSNVGGLGGIYLGLSIFALYNYFVMFLRKIRKFFNFQSETKRHKKESISIQGKPVDSDVAFSRNIRQLRQFKKYHSLDIIPVEKYNLQLPPIKENVQQVVL